MATDVGTTPAVEEGSVQHLLAETDRLADEIARDAVRRDAERILPTAELDALSAAGVLAVTVPVEHGGPGGGVAAAVEVTRRLAVADPNVAQVPQSHFLYLRLVEIAGSTALRERLFADVLAGGRLANAQSERGGRTITDISTTVRASDSADGTDGYRVSGHKFYATGSLFADWLAVLARAADGTDHIAFLPADSEGVTVVDDWDGFGQRTTGSGSVLLDDVRVAADHLAPRAEAIGGPHGYGPYAQLLHAAIDVGIARGALDDAAARVRTSARPWFEAGVERATQDPLLVQRFGELEVEVRAAEAALAHAARSVDHVWETRDPADHTDASLDVAAAKVLADRAALATSSALTELAGASSVDSRLGLDRHWRNARTHTSHDPVRWKIQHLGRWALEQTPPPRHGLI